MQKAANKTADRKEENEQLVLAVVGMASGKNLVSEVLEKRLFSYRCRQSRAHFYRRKQRKILETFQKTPKGRTFPFRS